MPNGYSCRKADRAIQDRIVRQVSNPFGECLIGIVGASNPHILSQEKDLYLRLDKSWHLNTGIDHLGPTSLGYNRQDLDKVSSKKYKDASKEIIIIITNILEYTIYSLKAELVLY